MQTQLVFGEPVIVEETKGDWAKVIAVWQPSKKDERGYPGWVPLAQLKEAEPIHAEGFAKVTAGKAQLWTTDGMPSIVVPLNTMLPYVGVEEEYLRVCTPDGYALVLNRDVDCSPSIHQFPKSNSIQSQLIKDLNFLIYRIFGVACLHMALIVRDLHTICLSFADIPFLETLAIKRKVALKFRWINKNNGKKEIYSFFANDKGKGNVRHVGFYFGDGLLLHSHSTGKSVEFLKLAGSSLEADLCAVRRYGEEETS